MWLSCHLNGGKNKNRKYQVESWVFINHKRSCSISHFPCRCASQNISWICLLLLLPLGHCWYLVFNGQSHTDQCVCRSVDLKTKHRIWCNHFSTTLTSPASKHKMMFVTFSSVMWSCAAVGIGGSALISSYKLDILNRISTIAVSFKGKQIPVL